MNSMNGMTFTVRIPKSIVGVGAASNIVNLVEEIGASKVLIVTGKRVASAGLIEPLNVSLLEEGISSGVFDECEPDAPVQVIERCGRLAREGGYQLIVGVGGGSVMDTAKVASVCAVTDDSVDTFVGFDRVTKAGLPLILVPTTSGSGSEWDGIASVKDRNGIKTAVFSRYIWPEAVIIDPLMTLNLPSTVTVDGGLDALTHAIEAYTTWKANLVSDMFAEKTIQLVSDNLRAAYAKGSKHLQARYCLAIAAALSMQAVVSAGGAGMVHGMSYAVAAKAGLTHGASCSLLLPFVMEFNLISNPSKFARIAELMGESVAGLTTLDKARQSIIAVRKLSQDVEMPQSLSELGINKDDIPEIVEFLFSESLLESRGREANARDMTKDDAIRILEAAFNYRHGFGWQ